MPYRLRMVLQNTRHTRQVIVHKGTVFEVMDAFSKVQNLVAAHDTTVLLPSGQATAVDIDTWCLNETLRPPRDTEMRPTVLTTIGTYADQEDVWADINHEVGLFERLSSGERGCVLARTRRTDPLVVGDGSKCG